MKAFRSQFVASSKTVMLGIVDAGWAYLPPDKAAALSHLGREWEDERQSKRSIEFWKKHLIRILTPHSWLQFLVCTCAQQVLT